jgi:Ca2+/Na+ antiporter
VAEALTYQAASLTLVIEGAVVLAVLVVVVMGTQLPKNLIHFRLTPDVALIAVIWVAGLVLMQRAGRNLPWSNRGEAPDSQPKPRGHSRAKRSQAAKRHGVSTAKAGLVFGVAAVVTLIAGALAEESGTAAANHVGLSGVIFGATVLAAATSLPELSTGLTAVRQGDYKLGFGDIFGGNAFLPVLFLLAVVVSGKAVLPNAHASDIYLTGLGALLTIIYMAGLLFRPAKQHARLGIEQHRLTRHLHPRRHRTHRIAELNSPPLPIMSGRQEELRIAGVIAAGPGSIPEWSRRPLGGRSVAPPSRTRHDLRVDPSRTTHSAWCLLTSESRRRLCSIGVQPTWYLMWVTPGASKARICASFRAPRSRPSNRRSPAPRITGAIEMSISSTRPAARY